ncbi:MAG: PEGA domain-containing protein [Spirochaetales bacterium]|nr:PEGA domain-containing protein [Spirochaetales bacterium]
MHRIKKRCHLIFFIIVYIFSMGPLSSQTESDVFPEKLRVGIARFERNNLPPAYDYLAESLPSEILEFVSVCDTHTLTLREVEDLAYNKFSEDIDTLRDEITSLRQQRDKLLFDKNRSEEKYAELSVSIEEKERALLGMDAQSHGLAGISIPLVLSEKNRQGEFLQKVAGNIENRNDDSIDYLIWGEIEYIEGLIYLYYEVYSFISGNRIFYKETVFLPENSADIISDDRDKLWTLFLGEEWSRLIVNAEPIASRIRLDGGPWKMSRLESGFILPGLHEITISAYGFKAVTESIALAAGEELVLSFDLAPDFMSRIPVRSYPQGADVYLGSQWMGETPLFLNVPGDFSRILLRKKGFDDYSYYIEGDSATDLNIMLKKSIFDWDIYVKNKRDRFYQSLGGFFLSIPVTVFLYSGYSVYSNAYTTEKASGVINDELGRLYDMGNICYYGYFGSLFVNSVLFTDLVFKAIDYVRSAGQQFKE